MGDRAHQAFSIMHLEISSLFLRQSSKLYGWLQEEEI